MKENKKQLPDGVYIITENNQIIPFNSSFCLTERTAYIGLAQGNHSIAVALYDVSESEIALTSKKDDGKGHYIDIYMDAVQDWQGKKNTEHLKAVGLNPAIMLKDGEYIPALDDLYLICLNRKAINAAMRFVGGQELAGWYWSSTEFSTDYAWYLDLSNGIAGIGTKATLTGKVRLVKQFI